MLRILQLTFVRQVVLMSGILDAVGFSAASTASASDCRYFISSYPTHQIGSALPLPKPWLCGHLSLCGSGLKVMVL